MLGNSFLKPLPERRPDLSFPLPELPLALKFIEKRELRQLPRRSDFCHH
jgi:hypothetical protein